MAKRWVIVVAEFDDEVSTIGGDSDLSWWIRDGGLVRAWKRNGEGMVEGSITSVTVTDGTLPYVIP